MGFFDRFFNRVPTVRVAHLSVHTANLSPDTDEKLVIITTTPAGLDALRKFRGPVQLLADAPTSRPVTFTPTDSASDPTLDPKTGWIIPVTAQTAAELAALPPGPGQYELESIHLGLVVED